LSAKEEEEEDLHVQSEKLIVSMDNL